MSEPACDVCDCIPANIQNIENYRAAVLQLLCTISGSTGGTDVDTPINSNDALGQNVFSAPTYSYFDNWTVENPSTDTIITVTGHDALVGDIAHFDTNSTPADEWRVITAVTANTFTVQYPLSAAPIAGDGVEFLRPQYLRGPDANTLPLDSANVYPFSTYVSQVPGTTFATSIVAPSAVNVTTESIIAVGVVSTPVLALNANRIGGWVKNISNDYIWVSFSGTATAVKPTKLAPDAVLSLSGGTWVYRGAVAAIQTAGGTLNLEVVEL